jgi:hypothetical protein
MLVLWCIRVYYYVDIFLGVHMKAYQRRRKVSVESFYFMTTWSVPNNRLTSGKKKKKGKKNKKHKNKKVKKTKKKG